MRNLGAIVEDVLNGGRPDSEELRYATIVLWKLMQFDGMGLRRLVEAEDEGKRPILIYSPKWQYKESFNRQKRAMSVSPKEWLGWGNDPDNPEHQKWRKTCFKIVEAASKRANEDDA